MRGRSVELSCPSRDPLPNFTSSFLPPLFSPPSLPSRLPLTPPLQSLLSPIPRFLHPVALRMCLHSSLSLFLCCFHVLSVSMPFPPSHSGVPLLCHQSLLLFNSSQTRSRLRAATEQPQQQPHKSSRYHSRKLRRSRQTAPQRPMKTILSITVEA